MDNNELRLGIDIGRVIIEGDTPGADTSFIGGSIEDALATPAVAGAFDAIRRLVTLFGQRVWLVSKCGKRVEEKSRLWLAHHRFFAETGMSEANVRFCRERPQKRDHALDLRLTHFIDDRTDVLEHLAGAVPHLVLFRDWPSAEAEIRASLEETAAGCGRRG